MLGALARVVTVREYRIEDKEHLIDVRLPALKNTGNTDLEQRVNTEISTRIQQVLDEAVFLRDGQIMLHKSVDAIREEDGKSVDDLFREVFRC